MNKFIILTNYKTLEKVAIPFEEITSIITCIDEEKRKFTLVSFANRDYVQVLDSVQTIVSKIRDLKHENLKIKAHLGIENKC